ncbi:phosphate signaling complex protein PhoU [Desulfonatronum lacustre]|uniref:phosphate signaling complex protein PhoU n=1 Tax=Desulfonatronum lacustre TaxID=66849 RepID=UPI00048B5885|nr:phosphate signaling complex protein PhoU [Desulfonatronum lacustre]SMP63853.1 phosphate transport system protein [Desulfonatronum zhilinae]
MQTRLPFHQELQRMHDHILVMAAATQESLEKAIRALTDRDIVIAEEVIDEDKIINQLECQINEMALQMLALSQPVARDLRFIIGGNWIARNIERVGDEAVNIAERAILLTNRPPLPSADMLGRIAEVSLDMYKNAIKAFHGHDEKMARYVCVSDEEVDELDVLILRKLIDHMISDTPSAESSVHAMLASHCFERVADLAVNISENAIFIDKGENIKHSCQKL